MHAKYDYFCINKLFLSYKKNKEKPFLVFFFLIFFYVSFNECVSLNRFSLFPFFF